MRYWVYAHDSEDEIVDDLDNHGTLDEAIAEAVDYLAGSTVSRLNGYTLRVVDTEADSTTVWIAGPGNNITPANANVAMRASMGIPQRH